MEYVNYVEKLTGCHLVQNWTFSKRKMLRSSEVTMEENTLPTTLPTSVLRREFYMSSLFHIVHNKMELLNGWSTLLWRGLDQCFTMHSYHLKFWAEAYSSAVFLLAVLYQLSYQANWELIGRALHWYCRSHGSDLICVKPGIFQAFFHYCLIK